MPHLAVQHSDNISSERLWKLCASLHDVLVQTGLFPLGGIRVRTLSCAAYAIADNDSRNAFADMVFRIGTGRSQADKTMTGERLMQTAEAVFATELSLAHFALSLEIIEIDPALSWKTNSIHPRLKGKS